MKAQVLYGIDDLRYTEQPIPSITEHEALVKVHAAGICGSDIPRIYATGAHKHPLIPGHEFSGEVVAVGSNDQASWMGKRVGIFPLIPCNECLPCKKKQHEMCKSYSYLGSRQDGGFAEYVAVPSWNLIELPENVTYEQAAMLEPTAVAAHAMRGLLGENLTGGKEYLAEKSVVILGLGTIGLLLAMLLKEAGIKRLFVIGNKDFQKECVKRLGIEEENYCDSKKEDVLSFVLSHTNANGADYVFECVGKNETISTAIDVCAPAGHLMLVGNPYTDMTFDKQTYWKILRSQLTVKGTWNSSYTKEASDDWHYVLDLLQKEAIHPEQFISHCVSLEELQKGLHIMRDKSEDYVKIMCMSSIK